MKILFIADNYPPETNAAATRVSERAAYWIKWGHEVTVITSFPNFPQGRVYEGWRNGWYDCSDVNGVRVIRVKTFIAPNKATVLRIVDFLSFMLMAIIVGMFQKRPDIVTSTSPQFFSAVAAWILALRYLRPFVFELGDIWPASITAVGAMRPSLSLRLVEKLELFLYRRSAAVAALTASFKRNLVSRGVPDHKIGVVLNGVDLARYAPKAADPDICAEWGLSGKTVFGYVGTHGMAHDLGNVLRAAALLKDRNDICFLLVGDGAERQKLLAEKERLELHNVVMQGPQPKEMMPSVWSVCDVALIHVKQSPVFSEVIPSKSFEAMAMGLPILAVMPEGEAIDIILGHDAGVAVQPGDPGAFAAAAREMVDNTARREELAASSLAAAPKHTREQQAEEMIKLYSNVLAGKNVAS